jgi:effector-binding domain-containing protein
MRRDTVNATESERWSVAASAALQLAVAATGLQVSGPTGALFSAEFFEHGLGVVTAFVPLDPLEPLRSQTARHGLAVEVLPAGYYAVTTHAGPYHDLDRTYGALGSHVAEHCAASDGPIREHYVTSPADVDDSADFRTELLWPIEFAEGVSP